MSIKIPYDTMRETVEKALLQAGLSKEKAEICAKIHTESSADGVESHGLNRVPRFVEYVLKGLIDPEGDPELVGGKGAVENYDGHLGIGITNALFCADRAMELAKEHGIGCVALKNTTHWMRGGTYAWRMAEAGYMGMSWINTESCMPLWGSDEPGVGNNPFCIAVPREDGPIVLDMAMSQYAYGKLGVYRLAGKKLPYPGGFDKDGSLTDDPGAIEESRRILPAGYWKGSSMAIALDLAAALMANGKSGLNMDEEGRGSCTGCCQIFIAYDPYLFGAKEEIQEMLNRRVEAADNSHPEKEGGKVACPGERTMETRKHSMENGVTVDEQIWEQILAIASGNLDTKDIASK
ncbi:3-dehydro-L-gulonate 2-dehydrogenase [Clostridium boliviensis]|uniref:3-dehydro-L-gulonate 2-dehydrogenase n=1 Tax=Clostridium boliviensis TaxID=318465 RepID=A0ABU4GRM2_9CLOT|nr:3-dehydro-L-gulonate 2-dehydrogenase [Clostridium boliviensis]MDW2800283.1 3-dehydro-L-gulonate 2-dehydrogenase [Clostridium boliviensis]